MGGKKVFELNLEIGHKSKPLTKKLPNGYTHSWTAYVRGINNAKIEHCIQRVVFQLHESFNDPHRDITEPPYQIKETGYAGFEIPIEIYFKNKEKQNHVVHVHDLCLLMNKPSEGKSTKKIKFINPNREFEKCLMKSGAQLLNSSLKKERSDSPPAKRQKSSSLIPSKDMSKQPTQPQIQTQPQSQTHHSSQHNHHTKQSQQNHNHHSSSNHHSKSQSHSQSSNNKPPKSSSRDFLSVFGAPIVYNSHAKQPCREQDRSPKEELPVSNSHHLPPQNHHPDPPQIHSQPPPQPQTVTTAQPPPQPVVIDNLQIIQNKISCLSDCDRLQKIVDIIEEAGEWFNITSKKFEFDLKRLDRKTLTKIERCLQL